MGLSRCWKMVTDSFPLQRMDDVVHILGKGKYFSVIDLANGNWQKPVAEKDKPKTAIVTFNGLNEFNVMPFGVTNGPATFQRTMNKALTGLHWKQCPVYLDDIIVFSNTYDEHFIRLNNLYD